MSVRGQCSFLQTGESLVEFSLNVGSAINGKGEVLVRLIQTLIETKVLAHTVRRPRFGVDFECRLGSLVPPLVAAVLRAPDPLGVEGRTAKARENAVVSQRCVAELLEQVLLIVEGRRIRLFFTAELPCPAFVHEDEWEGVVEYLDEQVRAQP